MVVKERSKETVQKDRKIYIPSKENQRKQTDCITHDGICVKKTRFDVMNLTFWSIKVVFILKIFSVCKAKKRLSHLLWSSIFNIILRY